MNQLFLSTCFFLLDNVKRKLLSEDPLSAISLMHYPYDYEIVEIHLVGMVNIS